MIEEQLMAEPEYLMVGELAHRVGVTVRTIQYYDQQGLLSPSAKGPQNQRLYTEENEKDLYRILTLKYLGLSLAEIKESTHLSQDADAFHQLTDRQMDEIEKSFQQIFKRLTTIRALLDKKEQNASGIDWKDMAQTIEERQDDSQFFWRLTCIHEDELDTEEDSDTGREETVSKWHELIADTIRLMSEDEAIDSPRNLDLAQRYLGMDESQQALSVDQNFILMENTVPHRHKDGSFDELRKAVSSHLEQVVKAYNANHA